MSEPAPVYQLLRVFSGPGARGNSAAVSKVTSDLTDQRMLELSQQWAPATAVFLAALAGAEYRVRWFGGGQEILRCGHGALAAAGFLQRQSGGEHLAATLVNRRNERFYITADSACCRLHLPPLSLRSSPRSQALQALCGGVAAADSGDAAGYIVVELSSPAAVAQFEFQAGMAQRLNGAALIVSSLDADGCVNFRYFFTYSESVNQPAAALWGEDQATGSAIPALCAFHTSLREDTGDAGLKRAIQRSPHGGIIDFRCTATGVELVTEVTANPAHC